MTCRLRALATPASLALCKALRFMESNALTWLKPLAKSLRHTASLAAKCRALRPRLSSTRQCPRGPRHVGPCCQGHMFRWEGDQLNRSTGTTSRGSNKSRRLQKPICNKTNSRRSTRQSLTLSTTRLVTC